jgi:hypothetical protein
MAIGTNDTVRKFSGTTVTLEASGGSCANAAIIAADDASYDLTDANNDDAPHALFAASVACSSAFTAMGNIDIIVQPLDIDGTNDGATPTATYTHRRVGSFLVKDQTATQYVECMCYDIPRKGIAHLMNRAGQTISSGWTLKITPFTFGPNP